VQSDELNHELQRAGLLGSLEVCSGGCSAELKNTLYS